MVKRSRAIGVGVALASCAGLLSGCGLIPPEVSAADMVGTWSGSDASIVLNADGNCEVRNFPVSVALGESQEQQEGREDPRFDTRCVWGLDESRDLHPAMLTTEGFEEGSGTYGLVFDVVSRDGSVCLSRTLGDPDSHEFFLMCDHETSQ